MSEATGKVDRRRRRPALACISCRRSKIRCDRQVPCGNCSKSKNKTCAYDEHGHRSLETSQGPVTRPASDPVRPARPSHSPELRFGFEPRAEAGLGRSTASSTVSRDDVSSISASGPSLASSSVSSLHVDGLQQRVAELERRLAHADKTSARHAWTVHVPTPKQPDECVHSVPSRKLHIMPRAVMSKTRYFGQSHWANAVLLYKMIHDTFQSEVIKAMSSDIFLLLNKCKTLGQRIKASRLPDMCSRTPGNDLPPRHVADELVKNYLRISESVYRVLHVPSFTSRYEEAWTTPSAIDPSFMVQLHLVMAIGCTVYDAEFSMRNTAIRWVFEAQWWMIAPSFKKRLTMTDLQSMVLLCMARELVGVDADFAWISAGSVLRIAMQMGLHRDPSRLPPTDALQAELRRRLWGTIIELNVQASLTNGCPALLSLSDFDTEPPSDIDDADLSPATVTTALHPTAGGCTDTTLALALRATLPARLAICRFLNDLGTTSAYEQTMELHENLAAVHKSTSRKLASAERASGRKLSLFQRQMFDCTIRRYFIALHIPHQEMALKEPAYAFSRTVILDNAIKINTAFCPAAVYTPLPPGEPLAPHQDPVTEKDTDLSRLSALASCSFRWVPVYTALLVGLDLLHQYREEYTFSPATPRPDSLGIASIIRAWSLRRIKGGDMNIKGYVFMTAQWVMIESLVSGGSEDDIPNLLVRSATVAIRTGLQILEEQIQRLLPGQVNEDVPWASMQPSVDRDVSLYDDWEGVSLPPYHSNLEGADVASY
ncbi:uncharacterized protein B0I36DRAFT_319054 [Microdochium trichocladiopsis]|uniref:Zn(2)-C6 fungal-type domain-containing protein n=1 Tax=Microdochium trichocladiopsis TaxID=1682393 RepID=A0A9P8YEZ6_9PEZI|nr:uncharacterized protein B0I36DRAFT_319054 [Microdochium trichocladiopsis]KAH7035772.1 hypothetical protein B0I36DRAFT_319054 [Microdochium trichocladiopsis]